MRKDIFSSNLQQALQNLYDDPTLGRSPLIQVMPYKLEAGDQSAGRSLKYEILKAIDQLRPESTTPSASPAWRVYEILQMRYVEGLIVKEMVSQLKLGGRQIRREIHRAIETLSAYLWSHWRLHENELETDNLSEEQETGTAASSLSRFIGHSQPQHLGNICESVLTMLYQLNKIGANQIQLMIPDNLPFVQVDRSLFRQVLLTTLVKAIEEQPGNKIQLLMEPNANAILFSVITGPGETAWESPELRSLLELSVHTGLGVSWIQPTGNQFGLQFSFPVVQAKTILIIDDDENSLHLYQRFLSDQPFRVISVKESTKAILTAEQEHPALIILDVLLPDIDGCEVLASLKTNPVTLEIRVVICSALYRPEIARSLGADDFLKKPVIRKDLLDMLSRWI